MLCEKCGTQLDETDKFCAECGHPVELSIMNDKAKKHIPGFSMAWYNFLIHGFLWIVSFLYLYNGVTAVIDKYHEYSVLAVINQILGKNPNAQIYTDFPTLKIVDNIYGIICILISLTLLYVMYGLKKYRAKAVYLYLTTLFVQLLTETAFNFFIKFAKYNDALKKIDKNFDISFSFINPIYIRTLCIAVTIGMIIFIANFVYFSKRIHMFN